MLAPHIIKVAETVGDLADKFSKLSPKTQENIVKFGLFAAAIGPVLHVVGTLTMGVGTLAGGLGKLSTFIGKVSGAKGIASVGASATTAVGTASAGTGIAGLSASLGSFVLAAAPYVAVAGTVAGTGYLIHKAMTKEAVPAVDLFEDKVTVSSAKIGSESAHMGLTFEKSVTKISESTKKAVGSFVELETEALNRIRSLYYNGTEITGNMKNDIVNDYAQMGQMVINELETQKNEQIRVIQEMETLKDEERKKAIEGVEANYEAEKQVVEQKQAEILEIIQNAMANEGIITQAHMEEINRINDEMRALSVQTLSETEEESLVILERMKDNDTRVTAEQMAEHIKILNQQRDEAVAEANQEYEGRIKAINALKVDGVNITQEMKNNMLEEAEQQRKNAVNKAEEQRKGVISKMQSLNSDLTRQVNTATGTLQTRWGRFLNWWNGLKFKRHVLNVVSAGVGIGNHWTGTDNFEGGLTYVGERGREL